MHTDFMAEKVKFDVVDGKAIIDNKEFIVDRVKPITLKETRLGRTRFKPFYILKWDKIEAANIQAIDVDPSSPDYMAVAESSLPILKTLEVVFPDKEKSDVLPEMLNETHDMRYMKHLKKYSAEGTGGKKMKFQRWMLIPVVFLVAAVAMYFINGGRFF